MLKSLPNQWSYSLVIAISFFLYVLFYSFRVFVLFFKIGFLYIALAVLELVL